MFYKIEPPYTERYVRWCEGTVNKLIIYLLLDVLYHFCGQNGAGRIEDGVAEVHQQIQDHGQVKTTSSEHELVDRNSTSLSFTQTTSKFCLFQV